MKRIERFIKRLKTNCNLLIILKYASVSGSFSGPLCRKIGVTDDDG